MHDVQLHTCLARQQCRAMDSLDLRHDGPRVQVVENPAATFLDRTAGELACDLLALRMNRNRQSKLRGFAHCFVEGQIVRPWKLGQSRIAHECLEPDRTRFGEVRQHPSISWHDPSPQREISDRSRPQRRAFRREFTRPHRTRRGVQGHVEIQGSSARGKRPTPRGSAFPMLAPRLVEVYVNINDTRQNPEPPRVDFALRRHARPLNDYAALHSDV